MTDTSTMPAPPAPRIQAILGHVAVPFFVFAAVLASLLTLSLFLLLPLLTQVEVAGVQRDARSLLSYRAQLINQVEGLEQERGEAVIPINDPGYEALKSWRRGAGRYVAVREAVLRTALSLSSTEDAIHVSAFTLEERTLAVEGDVRYVGPQSLTLLARFTEELGRLSSVASVTPPLFVREEDALLGMHSPFRILLHLP